MHVPGRPGEAALSSALRLAGRSPVQPIERGGEPAGQTDKPRTVAELPVTESRLREGFYGGGEIRCVVRMTVQLWSAKLVYSRVRRRGLK